jgi:RNA polymerase sigma-70 factor (ECF subfamily)
MVLARRAAGEDLAAFAALVRANEASLRRYLSRLAGEESDDLAQEALLAAWRSIRQWRADGSFAAWLRQIGTRRFLDRQRRAGPKQFAELDPEIASLSSGMDERLAVNQALAALPPRERAAALLVYAEGHSHHEAAQILGLPLGTLKSIVARARTALARQLEGVER